MPNAPSPPPDPNTTVPDVSRTPMERVGGAVSGFLKGATGQQGQTSPLDAAIQRHHDARLNEARMHRQNAATYASILASGIDPNTGDKLSDEDRAKYQDWYNSAWAAYEKAAGVNKDTKAVLGKQKVLLDHVTSGGFPPPPGASSAAGAGNPPASPGPSNQDTAAKAPSGLPAPPGGHEPYSEKAAAVTPALREGLENQQAFGMWKRQQTLLHQFKMDEVAAAAKAKAQQSNARPVWGPAISASNARNLAAQGKVFRGVDGEPLDLTELPDTMGLKSITMHTERGWETLYEPFSPNSKVLTVGNETYAINPMDVEQLTGGSGTALGEHRTPSTAVHQEPGIDLEGNIGTVTKTTTTQPQTPGARGRTGGGGVGGSVSSGRKTIPPPPGASNVTPAKDATKAAGAAKASGAGGGGGKPGTFIPFAAASQLTQRIIPVREAATQVFGDPTQPDLKSLKDYAYLANDSGAKDRLGEAVRLTLDGIDANMKAHGGLVTWLELEGGLPNALASAKAAAMSKAKAQLKPDERDAYNAIMSAYGAIIGLRSLTKASAAKFSVARLEQELPLLGTNVATSDDFYDSLSRLAEQVYNGTRTLPFPKQEKDFYKSQVSALQGLKGTRPKRPGMAPPPGAGSDAATEYLRKRKQLPQTQVP